MKRSATLFLPLLLMLASCGTTAQFAQQRFQDGIYARPGEETQAVRLYSEEDFAAMAAENISRKHSRDTMVVIVDDSWAWGGLGFGTYYWNRWRHGYGWYDTGAGGRFRFGRLLGPRRTLLPQRHRICPAFAGAERRQPRAASRQRLQLPLRHARLPGQRRDQFAQHVLLDVRPLPVQRDPQRRFFRHHGHDGTARRGLQPHAQLHQQEYRRQQLLRQHLFGHDPQQRLRQLRHPQLFQLDAQQLLRQFDAQQFLRQLHAELLLRQQLFRFHQKLFQRILQLFPQQRWRRWL